MSKIPKEKDSDSLLARTEKKAIKTATLLWNEIPHWLQDNHYIISGYRSPSNSYKKSAASIGHLHNETVNIWTHLIGAILAACTASIMYFNIKPRFELATVEDVIVFACYFLGAFLCLGMSATFHTISNHSEAVQKFGNRLDYIGIVVLIWGSFIPAIYYGFALEPRLIQVYWSMITTIGAGTLVVVLYPKFRTPEWRPVRALMFVLMGLSAVVPVIHGLQMYGYEQLERQMGLSWLVGQGVMYITGAAIYAARVPERWSPGKFDIWGSSHQIFHVLVVLAASAHFVGLIKAFDYQHNARFDDGAFGSAASLGFFAWS
ncbi:related to membrane proteins, contain hemolysin III domain [Ramularia collo-cygni]|uniref:Related to membrane proteins, contain hemolysin III domain n=1 Tax=Ramularia collo-cygni TaxID=112498 RepID=A0A2D3ULZ8_9PEZI|nr:related to membrane proteins, contain hemolysin III domain [Ramularia collo-cygni]CZT15802.1 related to membrane proteins, contain hemolysin III domain [Ramularia collo-cygni]